MSSTRSRIPRNRDIDADLKTPTLRDHHPAVPKASAGPTATTRVGRGATVSMPGGAGLHPPHRHEAAQRSRRCRSHDGSQPRAFAVWGQDESDSNASDSDV